MTGPSTFRIGGDLEVGRLGFGAMRLPTEEGPPREGSLALLRRAVELGVTLIDTAFLYGGGANEELIVEALHPFPEGVLVTTKIGVARSAESGEWALDGRPEVLREQVDLALARLRAERLDLLQLHRIDPEVPLADQIGTLRDLRAEGKIGRIGLSEVSVDELARAQEIIDVASVQNRYNLLDAEHEPVLAACEAAGIAFLPWRPVHTVASETTDDVSAVAAELGATPAQVALAWLLDRSPVMIPIPGTASVRHLEENVAAAGLRLTPEQRARLDRHRPAPPQA
ncbi:aldo/keto reductase [Streptomyces profundus]|uniref:aldo/keto reductase n=1 Tax=Streptomyces profundus TaxID=2867410 RepID=UPI001D168E0A|nr:aldo/keto reductase [Streptomyces sp. MA3_2.13]UED83903.1 aldo/keto reductase [Streptomyces sp. MA3_2.13]